MSDIITKRFGPVLVEVERYTDDGEPRCDCTLSVEAHGARYLSSLALSEHLGGPEWYGGNREAPEVFELSPRRLNDIADWAEASGY